jgi:hypothetical protein
MLKHYSDEIKNLMGEVAKKSELLKKERDAVKAIYNERIGPEDFGILTGVDISSLFSLVIHSVSPDVGVTVRIRLSSYGIEFKDTTQKTFLALEFARITKTSLIVEQHSYRIHIRLANTELYDIECQDKQAAVGLYKFIHLFITNHHNKN